jgi:hypothetical protein
VLLSGIQTSEWQHAQMDSWIPAYYRGNDMAWCASVRIRSSAAPQASVEGNLLTVIRGESFRWTTKKTS